MSNAIGSEAMSRVLDVTDELRACVRDEFEPFEGSTASTTSASTSPRRTG